MDAADLGAVHLYARARRAGLCVERTQPRVGLLEGMVVDAGAGAHAAVVATARGTASVAGRSGPFCPGTRWRRLIVVLQAGDVGAAVAPELDLDPVHRGAVPVGALAPVAELGEAFDRRLVLLEVEPRDQLGDGILCRGRSGGYLGRRDGRDAEGGGGEQHDERSADGWDHGRSLRAGQRCVDLTAAQSPN